MCAMSTTSRIGAAIVQSVAETRTVDLDALAPVEVEELDAACDDGVDLEADTEWWGTDEDGGKWRIRAPSPPGPKGPRGAYTGPAIYLLSEESTCCPKNLLLVLHAHQGPQVH